MKTGEMTRSSKPSSMNCLSHAEDFTDLDGDDVKPSNQATPVEDIPELDDEWLSENERRDKKERIDQRRNVQNEVRRKQAAEFEKLNKDFNPTYPVPQATPVSDDESSDDDDSVASSTVSQDDNVFDAPEGADSQESEGATSPVARRTRNSRQRTEPSISRNS